jgi:16S rRNA (adenine1518-N6/adenine1519-N6)-dimethyltransferase
MKHKPRKRFGQHFLHDPDIIQRIVQSIVACGPAPTVEIGPGTGALTVPLLQSLGTLDVVEVDRDLAPLLADKCRGAGNLKIHVMDVLQYNFCEQYKVKITVAGNLPFNISTPLLFHLLDQISCIQRMVFMMQKEVVDRICASPDSKDYGRLTVMVQSACSVIRLFDIPPGAFTPPPKVSASMVCLQPYPDHQDRIHDRGLFTRLVRQAFAQRRKTVRNSLHGMASETTLAAAGIEPGLRAENLGVDDYIRLANCLHDTHNL